MLKNVDKLISPQLIKILMEMGHGDTIVIGDANFPAASCAQRLVRCDGHDGNDVLRAILALIPLDDEANEPVSVMQTADGSKPPIWVAYEKIIVQSEGEHLLRPIERFTFYEAAKKAFAVVTTGEKALYANVILKKGVL